MKEGKTKYNAHMVVVQDSSLSTACCHPSLSCLLLPFFIFNDQHRINKMLLESARDASLVCIDTPSLGYDFERVRVDLITRCLDYKLSTN